MAITEQTIRCPKCGHEQTNPLECEACGLLFRKYEQAQERAKERETLTASPTEPPTRRSGPLARVGVALLLVAVTAALTSFLVAGKGSNTPAPPAPPVSLPTADHVPASPSSQPENEQLPESPPSAAAPVMAVSPIEPAQRGTVAIETPWGKGSGFFLTSTSIVTNKHVVEPDRQQLEEIRRTIRTGRQLIDLEQQSISELRNRLRRMEEGPTRRQLVIILAEKERQLALALPPQEEAEARLREMEKPRSASAIKIFLADGSEYTANSFQVSAKRDLALLSIYTAKAVVLTPAANNQPLRQGDKVFTIGNPVGLRNTVTAGIFSGYRQHKESGEIMLQTDAPINPGNSGGPLIDEQGRVHGVNTLIIQNTQGIGFAIPIQAVFEEFSLTPP